MTPRSRSRYRTRRSTMGETNYFGTDAGPSNVIDSYSQVDDVIDKGFREDGTRPPSDFFQVSERYLVHPSVSQSWYIDGKPQIVMKNRPMSDLVYWYGPPGGWSAWEKSNNEYVAQLLAETNPSRPVISVPVMIAELIEAATMFKIKTESLQEYGSSAYLNYTFGWETFLRDLKTLSEITKHIETRIIEFNSLLKHGGLRRKVKLGKNSVSVRDWNNYPMHSEMLTGVNGNADIVYSYEVWGTVRWRPVRINPFPYEDLAKFNEAARICLDLDNPDPSTVWEIIPFSWVIDYFINFGTVLQALESTDLLEPYDICIMRTRKMDCDIQPIRRADWPPERHITVSAGHAILERKYRTVINLTPPTGYGSLISWRLFSKKQALNLAALLLSVKGQYKDRF